MNRWVGLVCLLAAFASAALDLDSFQVYVDSLVPGSRYGLSVRSVKTGKELGNIRGRQPATAFLIGDTATVARREVGELFFWRSALSPEEVQALNNGKLLKSSLELYVPLIGATALENKAISTNTLQYFSGETTAIKSTRKTSFPSDPAYYNLLGQRVKYPNQGIILSRQGIFRVQ